MKNDYSECQLEMQFEAPSHIIGVLWDKSLMAWDWRKR